MNTVTRDLASDAQVDVIHGIDLAIREGEFIVFVGPSGCGKSTLLRMIAGLENLSGGEIRIDGRRVNDVPASERDLAMVFQSYALYPHMSVAKNLSFGLENLRVDKREIKERVDSASKLLQIEALMSRKPGQLSGGQRQRVAIGRAIVRQPCSMSRYQIWMRSCAFKCEVKYRRCIIAWATP